MTCDCNYLLGHICSVGCFSSVSRCNQGSLVPGCWSRKWMVGVLVLEMVYWPCIQKQEEICRTPPSFPAGLRDSRPRAPTFVMQPQSSGNAPITFKVTKSTRSDRKRPEVHRSPLLKAKCQLRESRSPLSAQIRRGKMIEKRLAPKVENIFLMAAARPPTVLHVGVVSQLDADVA